MSGHENSMEHETQLRLRGGCLSPDNAGRTHDRTLEKPSSAGDVAALQILNLVSMQRLPVFSKVPNDPRICGSF